MLAAFAPACPRPRVWPARAYVHPRGAQHHIRVGAVLRIEKRTAADRDRRIGLGDVAKLHSDVAFARIRAHRLGEHGNADLEVRRHLIEHRLALDVYRRPRSALAKVHNRNPKCPAIDGLQKHQVGSAEEVTFSTESDAGLIKKDSEFNPANHPTQTANANNNASVMIVTP